MLAAGVQGAQGEGEDVRRPSGWGRLSCELLYSVSVSSVPEVSVPHQPWSPSTMPAWGHSKEHVDGEQGCTRGLRSLWVAGPAGSPKVEVAVQDQTTHNCASHRLASSRCQHSLLRGQESAR